MTSSTDAKTTSSSSALKTQPTEISLTCSDGMKLAAQSWRSSPNGKEEPTHRILCLHGWMDNSRSFHYLAPYIVEKLGIVAGSHVDLVALDFPGHGMSDHRPIDGPGVLLSELTYYVAEAIRNLSWTEPSSGNPPSSGDNKKEVSDKATKEMDKITIIGHSMGAAVGCLYVAAFPEQVERLVLLEGTGPLARNTRDVAKHLRAHVTRRIQQQIKNGSSNADGNGNGTPRVYPSLEVAIKTRCQTARTFPGNQWLSEEAAKEMVLRGSRFVHDGDTEKDKDTTKSGGPLQFRHDPRLLWPSLQYFSQEQVDAIYQEMTCSTALIIAKDGWPFEEDKKQRLLNLLPRKLDLMETLPGSHHFHADPESAQAVAETVVRYLQIPLSE